MLAEFSLLAIEQVVLRAGTPGAVHVILCGLYGPRISEGDILPSLKPFSLDVLPTFFQSRLILSTPTFGVPSRCYNKSKDSR